MRCVLDHLAPGLPPLPQALLIRYGRHAHDAGCGIYPGLRLLSRELRTSPVTLRQARDWLQERRHIERLPRSGPHGTDLLRLGPCDSAGSVTPCSHAVRTASVPISNTLRLSGGPLSVTPCSHRSTCYRWSLQVPR
jgi:hypothetical protein